MIAADDTNLSSAGWTISLPAHPGEHDVPAHANCSARRLRSPVRRCPRHRPVLRHRPAGLAGRRDQRRPGHVAVDFKTVFETCARRPVLEELHAAHEEKNCAEDLRLMTD